VVVVQVELTLAAVVAQVGLELSQARLYLLQLMQLLLAAVERQQPAVMVQAEQQLH
jgi:hypothetical protein